MPDFSTRPGYNRHLRHRDTRPHHSGDPPLERGDPSGESPASSRRPDQWNHPTPTTRTRPPIPGSPDQLRRPPAPFHIPQRSGSSWPTTRPWHQPHQARENPPAGRAHSRPRIYLRPPRSREMPPNFSSLRSRRSRKNKRKIRDS